VLSEIGEKNDIKIKDEELTNAIFEEIRKYPGQEREVYEFIRKTPSAVARIRAPIYEDKVVNFALELAKVVDRQVSREELLADLEDDEAVDDHGHDHGHDHHGHDHDHHHHDHGHDHGHDHSHHHDHSHDHDHGHDHAHGKGHRHD
jgi:trigger factor